MGMVLFTVVPLSYNNGTTVVKMNPIAIHSRNRRKSKRIDMHMGTLVLLKIICSSLNSATPSTRGTHKSVTFGSITVNRSNYIFREE